MRKVSNSELAILERLIFIEDYHTVLSETELQTGELRDCLINLLNSAYVQAYEPDSNGDPKPVKFCDTDNLQKYFFRATNSGLMAIKKNS